MKLRNILLSILTVSFSNAYAADVGPTSTSPINLIPMYGYPEVQRTAEEKKADEAFIASQTSAGQSREQSSKTMIELGWKWKNRGAEDNAMRFFNLAWLMSPSNYESFQGFGVLLVSSKPAEAIKHFEKALSLIDDKDSQKPNLIRDTAFTYSIQARSENDKIKKEALFKKANESYGESVRLDPKNRSTYVSWAMSLDMEGDYAKSWQMVKSARALGGKDLPSSFIDRLSKNMPEPR